MTAILTATTTPIPDALEPFMLSASYGLTALVSAGIWLASGRAGLDPGRRVAAWVGTTALLLAWQTGVMHLSEAGVFRSSPDSPGLVMAVGVVLPVLVAIAAIAASPTLSRIAEAAPLGGLVAIQAYRLLGVVFVVLWLAGLLPGVFAIPAGFGDIAVGLAAPFVGAAADNGPGRAAWWNALGALDLVVAVSTGFLSSPGTLQLFAHDTPNLLVTAYPLALVPLYAVPVSFILHALVWHRLRSAAAPTCAKLWPV